MEEKKSMIVYFDVLEKTRKLSNEQFGILMRAVINYCNGNCEMEPEFEDPVIDMAFNMLAPNCKSDSEKWEEKRQKRSEAGKKGGAPIGNQNASKNKQNKQKQTKQAKQPVNVTVNVNDTVNDNVNNTVNKKEKELSTTTSTLCNTEDKSYVNRELGNKLYQAMVNKMSKTPDAWFTFTFKEAEAVGVDELTFKSLKQSMVDRGYLLQKLNASSINSGKMVWWYYLPKAKIERPKIVYLQKKHTNSTRLDVVGLDINLHNLMIQIPPETAETDFRTDFINLNRDRINEVVEKNCLKEFKKLTDIYIYIWEKIQNGEYSSQPQTIKTNEDEQEQDFVNPHMDELKACVEIAVENGEDPTSDEFVDTMLERFDDLGVDEIKKTISSISTKVLSKVG